MCVGAYPVDHPTHQLDIKQGHRDRLPLLLDARRVPRCMTRNGHVAAALRRSCEAEAQPKASICGSPDAQPPPRRRRHRRG